MSTHAYTFHVERCLAFGPNTYPIFIHARLPDGRVALPERHSADTAGLRHERS